MTANVKFLQGTLEAFTNLQQAERIDDRTFYFVDGKDLYLGSRKLSNEDEIANAIEQLEKHGEDIKALADTIKELTGGDLDAGSLKDQLQNLENSLKAFTSEEIGKEKARAEGKESELEGKITSLTTEVEGNKTDVNGKIATINNTVAEHTTKINEHSETIQYLQQNFITVTGELQENIETVDNRIDTLIGKDTSFTTIRALAEDVANEKVNGVIAGAPESFDTLKDIADWIENDQTGAASIIETVGIQGNTIAGILEREETLNRKVGEHTTSIESIEGTLTQHDSSINSLVSEDASLRALINNNYETLESAFTNQITEISGDLGTLINRVGSVEEIANNSASALEEQAVTISNISQKANENEGNINKINSNMTTINEQLNLLKSAAYETKEYFEGLSTAAKTEAIEYIDNLLTWQTITQ